MLALAVHAIGGFEFAGLRYARFVYFFFAGATVYNLRGRLTLSPLWAVAAVLLVLLVVLWSANPELRQLALAVAAPALVTWLAYVPAGAIRRFNALGDYSYGIYILAHPLQMLLREFLGVVHPLTFFALCMLTVLPLAALSWHGLESRALKLRQPEQLRRFAAVLGR